jgi:shikimate dehydrogenase
MPDNSSNLNDSVDDKYHRYPAKQYAAIVGLNPSKGARSPLLWNAAFKAHGLNVLMVPIDVEPDQLPTLLASLEGDRHFIGGAVAVPYKERVAEWLGESLTGEAASIGAVNCLFRREGRLFGTNTDGEAARISFESRFGSFKGKKILVLGCGGAGKAVAAYFVSAVGNTGRLFIVSRSTRAADFAERIGAKALEWSGIQKILPDIDAIINCTTLGSGVTIKSSPLDEGLISTLRSECVVFDIIYQPRLTILLKTAQSRGLQTLDGVQMNLYQAILAYGHAAPEPNGASITHEAMLRAVNAGQ